MVGRSVRIAVCAKASAVASSVGAVTVRTSVPSPASRSTSRWRSTTMARAAPSKPSPSPEVRAPCCHRRATRPATARTPGLAKAPSPSSMWSLTLAEASIKETVAARSAPAPSATLADRMPRSGQGPAIRLPDRSRDWAVARTDTTNPSWLVAIRDIWPCPSRRARHRPQRWDIHSSANPSLRLWRQGRRIPNTIVPLVLVPLSRRTPATGFDSRGARSVPLFFEHVEPAFIRIVSPWDHAVTSGDESCPQAFGTPARSGPSLRGSLFPHPL